MLKKIKEGLITSFQNLLIFYHISNFHANVYEGGREIEKNKTYDDARKEIFDLAETEKGILNLNILSAAIEILKTMREDVFDGSARKSCQGNGGDDIVRFFNSMLCQMISQIFRAVTNDCYSVILDILR